MFSLILLIIILLLHLLIGLIVFLKNFRNKTHQYFGVMVFFAIIWIVSNYFENEVFLQNYRESLLRLDFASAILLGLFFYLFCLNFPKLKIISLKNKAVIYIPALFLSILSFTNLIIKDIYFTNNTIQFNEGDGFWIYFLCIFFYTGGGLKSLVLKYKRSTGIAKVQIFYVFLGLSITSFIVLPLNLILPQIIFVPLEVARIGIYSFLAFCIFTAYAIIKHRFMDIRIVTGRSAIYLLSFATIVGLIFLFMSLNNQLAQPLPFNAVSLLIIGTLFSFFFFQLLKFYEKIAEEYFYHTFYNTKNIIAELEEKLTQVLELETFSFLITNTLINTLKLEKIGILVREIGDARFLAKRTIGFSEEQILSLVEDKFLIHYLQKTKKPILREELTLSITKAKGEEKEKLQKLQAEMKQIEANLLLLFIFERNLIGIIVLGNKVSGDAFYSQDIELLTTLSRSASIALKNASLYSEVKNRKEELERFYRLTVGRELQMKELKDRIIELEKKLKER